MYRIFLDFSRPALLAVAILCAVAVNGNATVQSQTADPFPANTVLTTGTQVWFSADFQVLDATFGALSIQSDVFSGGTEALVLTTVLTGRLVDIGNGISTDIALNGTIDIVIDGRTSAGSSGSWTSHIQDLALSGNANGVPVLITAVASAVSVSAVSAGTVTISDNGNSTYTIDDTFVFPPQISFAGFQPEPFAPLLAVNTDAPEPATLALLGLPLAGLAWARRRRARR